MDPEATTTDNSSSSSSHSEGLTGTIKQVIDFVYSKIGHPYIWGGIGQKFQGVESGWSWRETSCTESSKLGMDGYDCSGLCYCAYKSVINEEFPRDTYAMLAVAGYTPYPGEDQLKPGDLLFPSTGHVVMYTGNGKFVEAPRRGTSIREGDLAERNWKYWWRPMS